jgi:hypothetical protein
MVPAAKSLLATPEMHNHRRFRTAAEILWVAVVLLLSLHFGKERIASRHLPHGDEGSWMSVAAELSRGNGFTTRWLEHGFLKPYDLPRPDDYRYPGLSLLLAASFSVFGTSYTVGLWTVFLTLIAFGLAFYAVARRTWGVRVASASLPIVCFSLLQLMYLTEVYTEGLFGLGLTLIVLVSTLYRPEAKPWWPLTGAGIGLLYLVRPNAVLIAAAFALYGAFMLWKRRAGWREVATGAAAMLLVMLPWIIRTWAVFGNPFHLAGSAGLLRVTPDDPATYTIADFTRIYGIFYFIKATVASIPDFFRILHEQEHGLELLPLLFCAIGIFRRGRFFNGMIVTGFALSLFASFYTSNQGNWAGVRYFAPFLPFVYAFGISRIFRLLDYGAQRLPPFPKSVVSLAATPLCVGILLAPVYHPHRYYERYYAQMPRYDKDFSRYYGTLATQLNGRQYYYAGSLAQINFASGFNCVGMQYFFDQTEMRKAQKKFDPALLALTPAEFEDPYFTGLMDTLAQDGYTLVPLWMPDSFAVFVTITK